MKIIYKYDISVTVNSVDGKTTLTLPKGAQIIHVGGDPNLPNEIGNLRLWALIDTNQPTEHRTFAVVGTGHALDWLKETKCVGSVIMTPFIWHVLEVLS